jgi:hypothetical protein
MHRTIREYRLLTPPEPPLVIRDRVETMTPNAIATVATCGMNRKDRTEVLRWMLASLRDDLADDIVSRLVDLGSDYLVAAAFEHPSAPAASAAVCKLATDAAALELAAREQMHSARGVR